MLHRQRRVQRFVREEPVSRQAQQRQLPRRLRGWSTPSKPLQPNIDENRFIRSYLNLFTSTGNESQDEGNGLTRDDFRDGYTFFGFDLTPDACDGSCFHLVQKGNLRIDLHVAAALQQTINVVVYAEFESVLEIDKSRNVIYDF